MATEQELLNSWLEKHMGTTLVEVDAVQAERQERDAEAELLEQKRAADAIYWAGLVDEYDVVVTDTGGYTAVGDGVVDIVTGLDTSINRAVVYPMADELWLTGEADEVEYWENTPLSSSDWDDWDEGYDGGASYYEQQGGGSSAIASAAFAAIMRLMAMVGVMVAYDMVLDWLMDKIGSADERMKTALYLRGRLVGYTSGDFKRGVGYYGLQGKSL